MNIYHSLNQIVEYIEQNLENSISYDKLAQIMGVNVYTMQRLFSLLCNISLSEYIRNRRLSTSGVELYKDHIKIIDLAIKYQYDNPTSFSRAFEKFHGIKPSQVKEHPESLKMFAKLSFNEDIKPNENISYSIIEQKELVLYGKGIKTSTYTISQDAPRFFKEMYEEYRNQYGEIDYGMTVYENRFESDNFEYWILYKKKIPGFTKYIIPKSKWIVFRIDSQNPMDIQKVTNQFYIDFIPSCNYQFRELPELEYYHDDVTDFLVPIED